jgi:hypothetical protein
MTEIAIALLVAALHPFHSSVGEAQWNGESKRLEIALRLDPRDLDAALSEQEERRVVLERESDEAAQKLLIKYLKQHVWLEREGTEPRGGFHWVGREDQPRHVWVFFELAPPEGDGELRMGHRVLMEVEPTQTNTLILLHAPGRPALRFSRQKTLLPLPLETAPQAAPK